MDIVLSETEVRVLGCLIEKEIATPDYHPLTLNALTNACNQKSNRSPVVSYEEKTVARGLDGLRAKGLAKLAYTVGSRVPKYKHSFLDQFDVSRREIAVLCELMLRGPQTAGEIRARAERIYEFRDLEEVEEILQGLMEQERPMVIKLPRQAGRKELRYMHLFSGKPQITEEDQAISVEPATLRVRAEDERISRLEDEIAALRRELDALREDFGRFKSQF
ncbi:MAG TPA: YceH family protein [Thermodesulfovibrionales bacterium]|nr:YceH family protein [Thermodesulfovibrionales bacterium]